MKLNTKQKTALRHFAWVCAAGALASVATFIASPSVLDWIPKSDAIVVVPVLTSIISAARKWVTTEEAADGAGDGSGAN